MKRNDSNQVTVKMAVAIAAGLALASCLSACGKERAEPKASEGHVAAATGTGTSTPSADAPAPKHVPAAPPSSISGLFEMVPVSPTTASAPNTAVAPANLALAAAQAPAASQWTVFPIGETGMAAMAPSEPDCKERVSRDGLTLRICTVETQETTMMLSASMLSAPLDAAAVAKALDSSMEASAKGMGGAPSKVKDTSLGGARARDFAVATGQGTVLTRIVVKDRYVIQAVGKAKKAPSAISDAEAVRFIQGIALAK